MPYVDAHKRVRTGTLISSLALAGEVAQRPDTHVIYFDGDFPCTAEGVPLAQIGHQSAETNLGNGLVAKHSFSSKPDAGYQDYYEKMTTYAAILSGPAAVLKQGVTPRTFAAPVPGDDDDIFKQNTPRPPPTAPASARLPSDWRARSSSFSDSAERCVYSRHHCEDAGPGNPADRWR